MRNSAQHKVEYSHLKKDISLIDSAFKRNNREDFNKLVPLESMREFYASVIKEEYKRHVGQSRIISIANNRAYVLLSGLILYGNSGDETNFSNEYTGLYEFERIEGSWKPTQKIPIDRSNRLLKHRINLVLKPEKGIEVIDTLTIDVNDALGFAVKLNHRAQLNRVSLNGHAADFVFGGGLLWCKAPSKKNQQLIISYKISVERDEADKNSAYFSAAYGHLRNQYFWHPFFGFSSPNDRADFSLYCTIPKSYELATSLPQSDSIHGNFRTIVAQSEMPTFGLSIYYDNSWEVSTFKKDQMVMVTYVNKDFLPKKDVLYTAFAKDYDTLTSQFGKPIGNYLGIVQDRSSANGWKNRSNNIVVAGEKGSRLITNTPYPRATFGHEVAHGWTSPTGPATNFLMEGWATYAESLLLSTVYGDSIVNKFFASQKQNYIDDGLDGKKSLWEDYNNNGVSYSKGAWLFHMLAHQLGQKKLAAAMHAFTQSKDQSISSFMMHISKTAGSDMQPFLLSWLKAKCIPKLQIQQSSHRLILTQLSEVLLFPLEIQLQLKDGRSIMKTMAINSKEHNLNVPEGEIEYYVLDPKAKLLFFK